MFEPRFSKPVVVDAVAAVNRRRATTGVWSPRAFANSPHEPITTDSALILAALTWMRAAVELTLETSDEDRAGRGMSTAPVLEREMSVIYRALRDFVPFTGLMGTEDEQRALPITVAQENAFEDRALITVELLACVAGDVLETMHHTEVGRLFGLDSEDDAALALQQCTARVLGSVLEGARCEWRAVKKNRPVYACTALPIGAWQPSSQELRRVMNDGAVHEDWHAHYLLRSFAADTYDAYRLVVSRDMDGARVIAARWIDANPIFSRVNRKIFDATLYQETSRLGANFPVSILGVIASGASAEAILQMNGRSFEAVMSNVLAEPPTPVHAILDSAFELVRSESRFTSAKRSWQPAAWLSPDVARQFLESGIDAQDDPFDPAAIRRVGAEGNLATKAMLLAMDESERVQMLHQLFRTTAQSAGDDGIRYLQSAFARLSPGFRWLYDRTVEQVIKAASQTVEPPDERHTSFERMTWVEMLEPRRPRWEDRAVEDATVAAVEEWWINYLRGDEYVGIGAESFTEAIVDLRDLRSSAEAGRPLLPAAASLARISQAPGVGPVQLSPAQRDDAFIRVTRMKYNVTTPMNVLPDELGAAMRREPRRPSVALQNAWLGTVRRSFNGLTTEASALDVHTLSRVFDIARGLDEAGLGMLEDVVLILDAAQVAPAEVRFVTRTHDDDGLLERMAEAAEISNLYGDPRVLEATTVEFDIAPGAARQLELIRMLQRFDGHRYRPESLLPLVYDPNAVQLLQSTEGVELPVVDLSDADAAAGLRRRMMVAGVKVDADERDLSGPGPRATLRHLGLSRGRRGASDDGQGPIPPGR
jgi:hypothetical protein